MRRRQAEIAFVGALLLAAGSRPLHAASIDLHLTLTLDASAPDRTRISGLIQNTGQVAAFDLYAELWPESPRQRLGDLQPGHQLEVSWNIPTQRWIHMLHQIAAMRVRYRDALEHWADAVVAAGQESNAEASSPRWPEPSTFSVKWATAPAPSGRLVWWRPFALGILAADSWANASGALTVDGAVSPSSAIGGWKTSAYLFVLPDASNGVTPPGSIVHVEVDARDRGRLWRPSWPWLSAWMLACLLGWLVWSRRLESLPALTTVVTLGMAALALVPPALLSLDTTPAGGDYASHIVGLGYLRDSLLPRLKGFGWYPGQFGGFPLFLFYFPLPFLAAAAMSTVLPLTVAMKVASLLGTALLPCAWWLTAGWLGAPRSARWLAAAASAWLILGEWQTVWGANLPSTLAGEFAYSLGYALAWLTMAYAWKTRDERGSWRLLAALFALTAMSHGYALIAAACGILIMVVHPQCGPARAVRFAWIGAVAFSLAAWWLVPFLWNAPWTVGVRGRWIVSFREYLPPPLWVATAIIAIGIGRRLLPYRGKEVPARDAPVVSDFSRTNGETWLMAFSLAMIGMYAAGFSLGVVDVRFLPFFQGGLLLLASWEAGAWLESVQPLTSAAASVAVLTVVGSAAVQVNYLPDWVRWNFNGMQRTGPWPFFDEVMRDISGPLSDPRVVFEHHPDHDAVGTTRAFEMIPWFSGRSTLEGLYRESALLAAPVYYIQSELTRTPSCPIEGLECGRFNPSASLPHLGLFAVDTIVTYGDAAARALEQQAGVSQRAQVGPYEVFSIDRPGPLVEPARFRPVIDQSDDWRGDAYDWFRAATDLDVPLVLRRAAGPGEPHVTRYVPHELPREPLDTVGHVTSSQQDDTIDIANAQPGHPLFVKVAFHPGWRADDGSAIDLVAPGMMLVTPRTSHVVLRWNARRAGTIGWLLTVAGLVALCGIRQSPIAIGSTRTVTAGVAWCAAVIAISAGVMAIAMVRHPAVGYGDLLAAGQRATTARDFRLADRLFERLLAAPDRHHALRDDAGIYFALSAEAAGNTAATEARLRRFLDDFPVSSFRAEVLVRLGRILAAGGRRDEARVAFERAIAAPLGDPAWVEQARADLEDLATP